MENNENNNTLLISYSYLRMTDWYYIRKAETGEEVPSEVIAKRAEVREFIRANQGVTE